MHKEFPNRVETERLLLRKPLTSDAAQIFAAYGQDPDVSKLMTWRPLKELAEAENFVQQCISDWLAGVGYAYVIEVKTTPHKVIGMLDARVSSHTVDFGYVLAQVSWGCGFMSEALSHVSKLALGEPSIRRLQATCDTENKPSARVLEKCGFTLEGRLENYLVHPNMSAEPRACLLYSRCV